MIKKKKTGYIQVVQETYPAHLPKEKLASIIEQINGCTKARPVPLGVGKIIESSIMVRIDKLEDQATEVYSNDNGKVYAGLINKITSEQYRLEGIRKEIRRTKACQRLNL